MDATAFQLNKARRFINTQGRNLGFKHITTNEFGEPNGTAETVNVLGVYHEAISHLYLPTTATGAASIRAKPSPAIFCLWEDAQRVALTDILELNSKLYKVSEIKNVCEANLIGDISVEEVQTDGNELQT